MSKRQVTAYILFTNKEECSEEGKALEKLEAQIQEILAPEGVVQTKCIVLGTSIIACKTSTEQQGKLSEILKKWGLKKKKILAEEDWTKLQSFMKKQEEKKKTELFGFLNGLPDLWTMSALW